VFGQDDFGQLGTGEQLPLEILNHLSPQEEKNPLEANQPTDAPSEKYWKSKELDPNTGVLLYLYWNRIS
jgi:hypothetical protein